MVYLLNETERYYILKIFQITQYVWWIHKEDMKPLGNIP